MEIRVIVTEGAIKDRMRQIEKELRDFCVNVLELEDVEINLREGD